MVGGAVTDEILIRALGWGGVRTSKNLPLVGRGNCEGGGGQEVGAPWLKHRAGSAHGHT